MTERDDAHGVAASGGSSREPPLSAREQPMEIGDEAEGSTGVLSEA
jgi:hypothetical protein